MLNVCKCQVKQDIVIFSQHVLCNEHDASCSSHFVFVLFDVKEYGR